MPFTTYENRNNPHVAIHHDYCNQIAKRGGVHTSGEGRYVQHQSYDEASQYAESTGLPVQNCSFCNPR
ncbi:hypothetical protein KAR91_30025 [Candidatus Pacearchaeota archaeon]|nr:hypothetical protein [Candidatus Pacearchaeota archaeon]